MPKCAGTFNGTGADVYICIGFVPDKINVINLEGTAYIGLLWNRAMMGTAAVREGIHFTGDCVATEDANKGSGISPFYGGTLLSATLQTSTTYGEGVYLERDTRDYRYGPNLGPGGYSGDAPNASIDTWTLGSSANHTGNFNDQATGTYIGVGSDIIIDGKLYKVQAMTSNGEQANEVTLSHAAPSGTIEYIGPKYGFKPMAINSVTLDGFVIKNTTVNVNDATIYFEAETWD